MSNIKCQMSSRLNFCRSVPLEFLQSFLTSLLCIFHWHLYWHVIISWKIQWGVGRWCHSQEHLLSRPIYVIFMWDTCQIYVIFMSHTYHCPIHVTCISRLCHINCRWQIQRGVGVIPKSVFPNELSDNLGVWGWTLNQDDMEVFMIIVIVAIIICCERGHCHCHCQVINQMETGVRKIVPLITLPGGEQKIRDIDDINFPFGFTEVDSDWKMTSDGIYWDATVGKNVVFG